MPHLLKAEELDDGEGNGRVEAEATLVRANGAVELHAVATVHLQNTHNSNSVPAHTIKPSWIVFSENMPTPVLYTTHTQCCI